MSNPFESGAPASDQVAADPFWSVVRRRHPDIDIALLPPEPERSTPQADIRQADTRQAEPLQPVPPLVDRDDEATRLESEVARLWQDCVGDPPPSETAARWTSGARAGNRYEATWRLEDADPVNGVTAIDRAARVLADEGWHVLAPADGMPRVLAGRDSGVGRVELQLVLAPQQARLVLRLRSSDVLLADREDQA
ncbi:MAG: hypothetical protein LH477_16745 [Nocardioides sp.]|nr:hypothetical protein [Nocardioides sp.]